MSDKKMRLVVDGKVIADDIKPGEIRDGVIHASSTYLGLEDGWHRFQTLTGVVRLKSADMPIIPVGSKFSLVYKLDSDLHSVKVEEAE